MFCYILDKLNYSVHSNHYIGISMLLIKNMVRYEYYKCNKYVFNLIIFIYFFLEYTICKYGFYNVVSSSRLFL